jgi:hypothetical protein
MFNTKTKNRDLAGVLSAVAAAYPGNSATTWNIGVEPAGRARRIISSGSRSASGVSRRAALRSIPGLSGSDARTASPAEVAPTVPGARTAAQIAPKHKLAPGVPCALCMDAKTCLELGRCVRRLECSSPSSGRARRVSVTAASPSKGPRMVTKTARRPPQRAADLRHPIRAGETVTVIRLPRNAAPFVEGHAVVKGAAAERHRYRVQFHGVIGGLNFT